MQAGGTAFRQNRTIQKETAMKSSVLREDLLHIIHSESDWEIFRNRTFFITGATGLIGSLFIRTLLEAEREFSLGIRILALVRDVNKAEHVFSDEEETGPLSFICADICSPWKISGPVDYILHAAAVTTSRIMVDHPVQVIRTALGGMEKVLGTAVEKNIRKMVYLSSMEMYGQVGEKPADEHTLGYLDLSSVRTCYPESKRMCECMAKAWASEFHVPVCTARLAQTFGPGILEGENRVFAQMARSVVEKKNIVLKTAGLSEGNYCYTRDMIRALFCLFRHGESGEAYNVVNERTHMRIRDMAELVANEVACGGIRVTYEQSGEAAAAGYAPDVKLRLDGSKLRGLGWNAEVDLAEAYTRLVRELKEKQENGCEAAGKR